MTTKPILIDCDPGLDDAIALLLACTAADALDVRAITTVAGNVGVDLTARNAQIVLEIAGQADIPVHAGCAAPLVRPPVEATDFHGEDGLEGIDGVTPTVPLADAHAVDALATCLEAAEPGSLTLIATGPLTNIATLLQRPDCNRAAIAELAIMGGADTAGGNITAHAEFNIFADPHAADLVFRAAGPDLPITVFSLDFTHEVRCTPARVAAIAALGTPVRAAVAKLMDASNRFERAANGGNAAPLHDPCPVIHAMAPGLFTFETGQVEVVTEDGPHFGQTRFTAGDGPVNWARYQPGSGAADAIFDLLLKRFEAE